MISLVEMHLALFKTFGWCLTFQIVPRTNIAQKNGFQILFNTNFWHFQGDFGLYLDMLWLWWKIRRAIMMSLVELYLALIFDLWMMSDGPNSARNEYSMKNRNQIIFTTNLWWFQDYFGLSLDVIWLWQTGRRAVMMPLVDLTVSGNYFWPMDDFRRPK